MMETIFDDQTIDVSCECGTVRTMTVRVLKADPTFTCPQCGKHVRIEAEDLRKHLDEVQTRLDQVQTMIDDLPKDVKVKIE